MSFAQGGSGMGGGTDFGKYIPGYSTAEGAASLSQVVSVTGKGILVGIAQKIFPAANANGTVKVTIDGVVVINDTNFSRSTSTSSNDLDITCMFSFKKSLLVEHSTTSGTAPVTTKASYLLG